MRCGISIERVHNHSNSFRLFYHFKVLFARIRRLRKGLIITKLTCRNSTYSPNVLWVETVVFVSRGWSPHSGDVCQWFYHVTREQTSTNAHKTQRILVNNSCCALFFSGFSNTSRLFSICNTSFFLHNVIVVVGEIPVFSPKKKRLF